MTQSFADWLTGCCASRKKNVPTDDTTIEPAAELRGATTHNVPHAAW
jgi:hypothetical protein